MARMGQRVTHSVNASLSKTWKNVLEKPVVTIGDPTIFLCHLVFKKE